MPPTAALIICVVFVVGLLRIEHQRNLAASHALWIPTFWTLLCGSKPLGIWFESKVPSGSYEAGSPLDRLVLSILILLALLVLFRRKIDWSRILKDNFWLVFLYLYLAFSILWSDFPYISFKRWIKLAGMIPMALVVLSESSPLEALESVLRRCAYVLIPFSLLLIKYFPLLGVAFNRWTGVRMWVGVTPQKNGLGMICALSVFFLIWAAYRNWKSGEFLKSRSHTIADGLVLGIALLLLRGPGDAYSATSISVLVVGIVSMLLLYRRKNFARRIAANLKFIVVGLAIIYLLLGNALLPMVTSLLGRDNSLTGRTDIWRAVLDVASRHPLLGTGYGNFWGLENEISSTFPVDQAHNGYLGVYLELGIVGIVLLSAFLLGFCAKIRRQLSFIFDWGVFGISFLFMVLLWNYSEHTFLRPGFLWTILVFVMIVFSASCLQTKGE